MEIGKGYSRHKFFLLCQQLFFLVQLWNWSYIRYNRKFTGMNCFLHMTYVLLCKPFFQLNIQDVHIRYEDPISIPSKCVAFGATIESLVAQSCDLNWVPGIMQASKREESFKLLELQNFGLYWINLNENEMLSNFNVTQLSVCLHVLNLPNKNLKFFFRI